MDFSRKICKFFAANVLDFILNKMISYYPKILSNKVIAFTKIPPDADERGIDAPRAILVAMDHCAGCTSVLCGNISDDRIYPLVNAPAPGFQARLSR